MGELLPSSSRLLSFYYDFGKKIDDGNSAAVVGATPPQARSCFWRLARDLNAQSRLNGVESCRQVYPRLTRSSPPEVASVRFASDRVSWRTDHSWVGFFQRHRLLRSDDRLCRSV